MKPHHEQYVEVLETKKKLGSRIVKSKRNLNDIGLKLSSNKTLNNIEGFSLDNLTLPKSMELWEKSKEELGNASKAAISTNEKFDTIKKEVKSRNLSGNKDVLQFLKKHNSDQKNGLKSFFKLEKDPKNISKIDSVRLFDIANKEHNKQKKSQTKVIEHKHSIVKTFAEVVGYTNLKENINTDELNFKKNHQKKKELEKPLIVMLDKIIDLKIDDLKKFIQKNNVNLKTMLLYVKEFIKDTLKINKKEKPKHSLEKLKTLETNLGKIDKDLSQDQSKKAKKTLSV